jgi:hypothetical protein
MNAKADIRNFPYVIYLNFARMLNEIPNKILVASFGRRPILADPLV